MSHLLQFFRSRKGLYLLGAILTVIAFWAGLRGCSRHHPLSVTTYTIAVDRSWYPIPLYGKEKNMLAFTDELLEEIGAESGLRFILVEVGTPNLIQDLESGIYDAVITSKPPTHLNTQKYRFSDPIYLLGPVLVVSSGSAIKSVDQLLGQFVGIRRGLSLAFDSPLPDARIIPYDNMTVALADLEDNKIDALIMDSLLAHVQIQGIYTGKVKIVTGPLSQDGLRLMTLNNPLYVEFIGVFNETLKALQANGKYEQLLQRWGLFNSVVTPPQDSSQP